MKNQVNINTGTPLSKNKSFTRSDKLKATFKDETAWTKIPDSKKKFNKERFLMWIMIGSILVVMIYCAFFVGLKKTNFFGAETKNAQELW